MCTDGGHAWNSTHWISASIRLPAAEASASPAPAPTGPGSGPCCCMTAACQTGGILGYSRACPSPAAVCADAWVPLAANLLHGPSEAAP